MKGDGKTARIVLEKQREINEIRQQHPDTFRTIDGFERDLRERLRRVHALIAQLDMEDQELVSTAVIHGLHRMTDEIFL